MNLQLQIIQDFLELDNRREICVFNFSDDSKLTRKLTLSKIFELGYSNLEDYINALKAKNPDVIKIYIERYTPNGARSSIKVKEESLKITWSLGEGGSENDAENIKSSASTGLINTQKKPNMNTENNFYPGQMNGAAVIQHLELMTKAKEADTLAIAISDLKEEFKEKKQDFKEEKRKLVSENEKLIIELRDAKSKIDTADKLKDLEIREINLTKKPFIDSETGKKALEVLGPVLAGLIQKGQPQADTSMMQGVEDLSNTKQTLIKEISKPEFSESMASNLMNLYVVLLENNPDLNQQLKQIIENFNQ